MICVSGGAVVWWVGGVGGGAWVWVRGVVWCGVCGVCVDFDLFLWTIDMCGKHSQAESVAWLERDLCQLIAQVSQGDVTALMLLWTKREKLA